MVKKAKKKPVEVEFIQYKGTKNKKKFLIGQMVKFMISMMRLILISCSVLIH
ncbi:hypothetical protein CoNPh16_CDS0015 [Staphylococcus phage S-CoN_Ph16]|nr:hypothetical protein CoNPh16_CDS0015 [Staphylococcus phage S-CoN_Ph16]